LRPFDAGYIPYFFVSKGFLVGVNWILVRILIAHDLQLRLTRSFAHVSYFWLVPIKDLLQAAIWFGAFLGNRVEWRGQKFKLRRDGTLEPLDGSRGATAGN
jgi:hypothetical protein